MTETESSAAVSWPPDDVGDLRLIDAYSSWIRAVIARAALTGQLLPDDLEEQRPERVHRGDQLVQPGARVEVRVFVDELRERRIRLSKVRCAVRSVGRT